MLHMSLDKEIIEYPIHVHDLKNTQTIKQQQQKEHQSYSNSPTLQDFISDNSARNPIL